MILIIIISPGPKYCLNQTGDLLSAEIGRNIDLFIYFCTDNGPTKSAPSFQSKLNLPRQYIHKRLQ